MLNSLELFSGAGGLAKGIEMAGISHIGFIERNPDACKTLRGNYPAGLVYQKDIVDVDFNHFSDVDIIAGGPPCQPFSLGGKARGADDSRDMFPYAVAAIRTLAPKAFIFENVKGLMRQSFADYFRYIVLQLTYPAITRYAGDWKSHLAELDKHAKHGSRAELSYKVDYRLLNAADFGIPQKRDRVILVGIRDDVEAEWAFPEQTHSEDALLWSKYVTGEYWDRHGLLRPPGHSLEAMLERKQLTGRYGMFAPPAKPWLTVRDAIADLPDPGDETGFHPDHFFRGGAKSYPGHTGSEIDQPAKALKAGDHGVPGGENMVRFPDGKLRYFTLLEAKRIQTFPDDYQIHGSWTEAMRQLGNAVPVRLGQIIASTLAPHLTAAATTSAFC